MSSPFDLYADLVEAAKQLGIHPQSLRRLIKQKKLSVVFFGGKYLIHRDDLCLFQSSYDPYESHRRFGTNQRLIPAEVVDRILFLHDQGTSPNRIAGILNAEGVPTAKGGGQWWDGTVRGVLQRERRLPPRYPGGGRW